MTKPWPLMQALNAVLPDQVPGPWLCNAASCCQTGRRLRLPTVCRSCSAPAIVIESDEVEAWFVSLLVPGRAAQGRLPRVCASPAGQLGVCGIGLAQPGMYCYLMLPSKVS